MGKGRVVIRKPYKTPLRRACETFLQKSGHISVTYDTSLDAAAGSLMKFLHRLKTQGLV